MRILTITVAMLAAGCGLEASLGDAVSGGQFVEYVPEPDAPQTLGVRVSDQPGGAVVLGEHSATADAGGWAALEVPSDVNLRFAVVEAGPLAALVPPGAAAVAMDDRTTADVRFLRALGGDLQSADGVGLMNLLNTARSAGGGYYQQVTRDLLGLPNTADEALAALAAGKAITPCVDQSLVRVVFQVEMADDMRDGNCAPIDRFRWATDVPDASMFITGGVHEDFEATNSADALAAHEALGGWLPNVVPMQNSGEGLWTYVVDLPRADPPLQLGYKFTWGLKGSTWTGTEEWPGNQRLLEVADVDGDGLIVVRDRFGDEASNKDRQNLRRGGLGAIDYTDPAAREHAVDLDGDCVADAFPRADNVAPLLGDCADPGAPPAPRRVGDDEAIEGISPQSGGNGGGTVVTVQGRGFVGGRPVMFGDAEAAGALVRGPTELVAVTPELPVGVAALTLAGGAEIPFGVDGPAAGSVPECALQDVGGLPDQVDARHEGARFRIGASMGPAAGAVLSVRHVLDGPDGRTARAAERSQDGQRYEAWLELPGRGTWSHGFQVSADAGATWRDCDDFGTFEVR